MPSRIHGRNTARRCFLESGAVELRRPTITTTHFLPLRRTMNAAHIAAVNVNPVCLSDV